MRNSIFSALGALSAITLLGVPAYAAPQKDQNQVLDITCHEVRVQLVNGEFKNLRFQCNVNGDFQGDVPLELFR